MKDFKVMKQEIDNFARFYSILKRLPYEGDREELKKELVSQATNGRTEHLREMTKKEYIQCCIFLEKKTEQDPLRKSFREALRRARSIVLHLLQQIGVDTADWSKVNAFCISPKISGKEFKELGIEELEALQKKLRAIQKKNMNL